MEVVYHHRSFLKYSKHFWLVVFLFILTITIVIASLGLGAVPLTVKEVCLALWQQGDRQAQIIAWELRLPRLLLSLLVGGALGIAGVLLQGMLRNGLADPFVCRMSVTDSINI